MAAPYAHLSLAKRGIYCGIILLLTLGTLEAGVLLVSRLVHREEVLIFDEGLGWKPAPNLEGARQPRRVYTDSHGFRIGPHDPRDERQYDLMFFGDSFCWGSWVDDEESLVGLFRAAHPSLRVANAGVAGYGTDQELMTLERHSHLLKPGGTIVLMTYLNDFQDIRSRFNEMRERPWYELAEAGQWRLHAPSSALNRLRWWSRSLYMAALFQWAALGAESPAHGDDALSAELYESLLERMAAVVKQREGRLIVVYTSGREGWTSEGRQWAAVARRAAERIGARYVNLDENLEAARPEDYLPGDIHWNAAGSRRNYEYLASRLGDRTYPANGGLLAARLSPRTFRLR